jgi:Fungal specific transcription factor domain
VSPNDTASRDFAAKCAETVEFHLFRTVGTLSESNVLLFVLSFTYNFFIGQYGKCWQNQALASRLVTGLQLNWETHPEDPRHFLRREVNRRLVWQIFTNDRHLAGGFEEYILLHEEHMKLRLPCNDEAFRENKSVIMERLADTLSTQTLGAPSISAYYVRLMNIRHHILA